MVSIEKLPGYFNLSYGLLASLLAYGIWFIYSRDGYTFNLGGGNFADVDLSTPFVRYVLPLVAMIIFFGFIYLISRLEKRFSDTNKSQTLNAKSIVFIVLISEILISIIWGVQWRVWYLGIPPLALYFNQVAFFVIAFPVKAFIVLTGLRTYQQRIQ